MRQKTQNHFLNFLYICLQESPGKITDKHMENLTQASGELKAQVRLQKFLGQSFALQLQFSIDIFLRTAVLRKLFDFRFSYKHRNFSLEPYTKLVNIGYCLSSEAFLRANVCNFRESVDSREFLNFFIFCSNNLYSTLISKITLKLVTAFYFFRNQAKFEKL